MPRNRQNRVSGALAATNHGKALNALQPQYWVMPSDQLPPRHDLGIRRRVRRAAARALRNGVALAPTAAKGSEA